MEATQALDADEPTAFTGMRILGGIRSGLSGDYRLLGWRLCVSWLALSTWLLVPSAWSGPVTPERADVRVLIDVSGSMKLNDPKNLRRPALRLLVGLLPKDTRAGVWTFAQYVNMQIPLGRVDDAWKQQARASSQQIASPGQFTNIEQALIRATADWQGPPASFRRRVVLLTDGMVDISKNDQDNRASRQRILDRIVPRLRSLGVSVHTVALSKNADHELMRKLAESTDGWYQQVENADQLQRVFLRIFEKVGNPDMVPLQDNRFTIDASVTEATVLVFRKPDARQTQLISPQGERFTMDDSPSSIVWHRDQGYDMLTMQKPQTGEWKIAAEIDPDNRVMVVTDLRMQTSPLPNRLVQGQVLPLEVSFTDHDRQIRQPAFLDGLTVTAMRNDRMGGARPNVLQDDGRAADSRPGDGIFTLSLGAEGLPSGGGELVINAQGRTFVREKRLTYEVVAPLILEVKPDQQGERLLVSIRPDETLVDAQSMRVNVWLEDAQGGEFMLEMTEGAQGLRLGRVDLMSFAGSRRLFVQANGTTQQGRPLDYTDSPIDLEGLLPVAPEPEQPLETTPIASGQASIQAEPGGGESPQTRPSDHAEEPLDWTGVIVWLVAINLLLGVAGGGGFWWWHKIRQRGLVAWIDDEQSGLAESREEAAA